jgi:ABC-type uncharacterized transport system permease subunit
MIDIIPLSFILAVACVVLAASLPAALRVDASVNPGGAVK